MKLSKTTILELGTILKEEFNLKLENQDLERLAYTLVSYFSLLIKIENRHKFQNRPDQAIDSKKEERLNEEG